MRPTKGERFLEAFTDIDDKFLKEAMNYTMKKRFNFKPIIAIAACAALALAAVPAVNHFVNTPGVENPDGNGVSFTVYESGIHEGVNIGTHKIELELNISRTPFIDKGKLGSTRTVMLNGFKWTGEYTQSKTETDYTVTVDEYVGVSNGKNIEFVINSVTGKCEYLFVDNRGEVEGKTLTRDELYEIAYKNFMNGGYTDDPENYMFKMEYDQGAGGYSFKFSRFIDGIETCDYVVLCFRKDGKFSWFIGNRVGEMKDVDVSEINMDKLYEAVEAKLNAIYADAYIGFDKKGAVLTKLTDGSYVFDYGVATNVKNDSGKTVVDTCYLTIRMEK